MAIKMSVELFQEWITKGFRIGGDSDRAIECIKGLPEGAKFIAAKYLQNGWPIGTLFLVFEHPSFPIIHAGGAIPRLEVEHRELRYE